MVRQRLEAGRYGTSSASSFSSSGIWLFVGRRGGDGRRFSVESTHFGGNISGEVDTRLRRYLVEGDGSKLDFGDENPELGL